MDHRVNYTFVGGLAKFLTKLSHRFITSGCCAPSKTMNYTAKDDFPYYFELAKEGSLIEIFSKNASISLLETINEERSKYRYAPDKWSIKRVLGHITDHERIKMFRAFQLSRKIELELWGYDQESLVRNSRFDEHSISHLLGDYLNVRKSSLSFIEGLSPAQLEIRGSARQYDVSLEEFLRSVIGHETHHLNILKDLYGL